MLAIGYAFTLLDQDLFFARGRDGAVRCFYNVCQHRGHSRDGVVDGEMQAVIGLDRATTFAEDLALVREVQRGLGSRGPARRRDGRIAPPEGPGLGVAPDPAILGDPVAVFA